MSDGTYNGWRNYETWNVALWLTSADEATYRSAVDLRRRGWDAHRIARRLLGDETVDGVAIPFRQGGKPGAAAETLAAAARAEALRLEMPGASARIIGDHLNAEGFRNRSGEPFKVEAVKRLLRAGAAPAPVGVGGAKRSAAAPRLEPVPSLIDWDAIGEALDECGGGS